MKSNKRTVIKAHDQLEALTERILGQMGKEGEAIRRKLKLFYRRRHGQPLCVVGGKEMQRSKD
jgi:hypothetical protein